MSRDNSPVRDVTAREGSARDVTAREGSVAVTGDQFVLLLEEVWQLQEGQEDAMLKLEKGVHHDPYIFKCHGNENQYHFCKEIAGYLTSIGVSRMWWWKGSLRQSKGSTV